MTKALMTRVRRLEAVQAPYSKPRILFVKPPEGMTPDQVEAHQQEVREAADDPRTIFVCYHSPDGSDSLSRLMGHEAADISRKHREIALQRSYGHA